MFVHNTWIMKIFFCNTWIMKIRKCLFAIHEILKKLKCPFEHKNYEKVKILFCNRNSIYSIFNIKMFVCNHKLWKNENICCQYMNYEIFF